MNFDIVVENKIKEAYEAGWFDNLPGAGRPLRLEDNPHEPAAWRLAHQLIKDSGFTLPWIAERHELEEAIARALGRLASDYADIHRHQSPDIWAQSAWRRAQEDFAVAAAKLNRRIRNYNLQTPALIFHRALLDAEREIERVRREAATAGVWKAAGKNPSREF